MKQENLEKALNKIREMTANQIAGFFRRSGIRGEANSHTACPIANYIRRNCPSADRIFVTKYSIFVYKGLELWRVQTPTEAVKFIAKFDTADSPYSDLRNAPQPIDQVVSLPIAQPV